MYPIELSYHGIRFLPPQRMGLGGPDDHVILGGPNGAGKSSVVLAAALALGSMMVEPYSLRNSALPEKDEWRAATFWLFHNPPNAPDRPSADEYIALGFELVHPPRQAVRIVWVIKEGPAPDELSVVARFTDPVRYVDEIRTRYRVDPDRYAMFWFQSQITRFVDLNDDDKAREMLTAFELGTQERNWHEARRACRAAYDELNKAEYMHRLNEGDLSAAKSMYNRWLERKQGVESALRRFLAAYGGYRLRLESDERGLHTALEEVRRLEESHRQEAALLRADANFAATEAEQHRTLATQATEAAQQRHKDRGDDLKVMDALGVAIAAREAEHKSLIERQRSLRPLHELEVQRTAYESDRTAAGSALAELAETIQELERDRQARTQEQGKINSDCERLRTEQMALQEEITSLPARAVLTSEKADAEAYRAQLHAERSQLHEALQRHRAELEALASRRGPVHPEQQRALSALGGGWPVGLLLDVRPGQSHDAVETKLGALKHSVVTVTAASCASAPVYHLSLAEPPDLPVPDGATAAGLIVPATELPDDFPGARIESLIAWLERVSLVPDAAAARLRANAGYIALTPDGTLWDRYGSRGPLASDPAIGPRALERACSRLESALRRDEYRAKQVAGELTATEMELERISQQIRRHDFIAARLPALADDLVDVEGQLAWYAERLPVIHSELQARGLERESWVRRDATLVQSLDAIGAELRAHSELDRIADQLLELEQWKADHKERWDSAENHRRRASEQEVKAGEHRTEADRWQGVADDAGHKAAQHVQEAETVLGKQGRIQQRLVQIAGLLAECGAVREDLWRRYSAVMATVTPEPDPQWLEADYDPIRIRDEMDRALSNLRLAESIDVPDDADQTYLAKAEAFRHKTMDLETARSTYVGLRSTEKQYRDRFRAAVETYHDAMNRHFQEYLGRAGLHGSIVLVPPPQMDDEEDGGRPAQLGRSGYRWELHVARVGQPPRLITPQIMRARVRASSDLSGGERAAVSLVHALAMLSCLNVKPPFYLLDEFDSALDESNRRNLFDLTLQVVGRKIITVSPRAMARDYLRRFSYYFCYIPDRVAGSSRLVRVTLDTYQEEAKRQEQGGSNP